MRPVTHFFRSADYLKFLTGFRKLSTKMCAQLHVFSLWRLTWVFDGTWKNFHKKVGPVTRFFAVETILSFWRDLESFDKKVWPVTHFFAVQTILSFWGDLESFDKKVWPVTHFVSRCRLSWVFDGTWKVSTKSCDQLHLFGSTDYRKNLMGLGNFFTKKCAQLHVVFAVETNLSFEWDLEMFRQKCVPSYTFSQCRLSQVFDGT